MNNFTKAHKNTRVAPHGIIKVSMSEKGDYGGNVRRHVCNGVTWVDVQGPGPAVLERLGQEYGLHPLHLNESLQTVQHNEVEHERHYLFMVMHFPLLDEQTDRISFGQLSVFLGKDFLVTVHREHAGFLDELYGRCEHGPSPAGTHSAARLLNTLIGRLLTDMETMTESIDVELDAIEGLVFENSASDAERIGRLRRKIIRLRRLIGPKRLLLQDLTEQIGAFAGKDYTRYYAMNVKMVEKLWEEVEEARETVEIYKDADFITSTEQTNNLLAVLTLVFTFTIPATVVAALYGMNVFLPGGLEAGSWTFLGKYTTLWLVLALSASVALGMFLYFRRKKWV